MEFVVDWNSVCLVCLQEGDMRSIYEKDEKNMTLSEKIMRCSTIEIRQGMSLPEQICSACYDDLIAAYRFHTNCESTNIILKSFLNSNVTNLEIPSPNGQTYKYKLPLGLNVKRVKIKPEDNAQLVKSERVELVPEEPEDVDEYSQHFTDAFIITELEDRLDEDDEPLSNLRKKDSEEHEVDAPDEENIVEMLEQVEKGEDMEPTPKKRAQENAQQMRGVRKGRGRKSLKSDQVQYNGDVQDLVENLTTITYVRKVSREDGKPMKICEICGNSYKYQHALESHMRRHRNEKPFSCEFCDRAFVANVELRRHMRVHTGQKPYPCRYCNRRFSDFGSRIKHERTHTGERPYTCATCGKSFAYAHVLSVHALTHTGEKKFKCNVCGKGFTKKVYLMGHMKLHNDTVMQGGDGTIAIQSEPVQNEAPQTVTDLEEVIFVNPKVEKADVEILYDS